MLEDVDLFAKFAAIGTRSNGLPHIEIAPFDGAEFGAAREIALPEPVYIGARRHESGFSDYELPIWVSVAGHASFRLRTGHHHPRVRLAQAAGGPGRLRPHALRFGARLRRRRRRNPGSRLDRLPPRPQDARAIPCTSTPTAPTATHCRSASTRNRLSLLDRGVVMAYRPHPRRRRHGQALARCRQA